MEISKLIVQKLSLVAEGGSGWIIQIFYNELELRFMLFVCCFGGLERPVDDMPRVYILPS